MKQPPNKADSLADGVPLAPRTCHPDQRPRPASWPASQACHPD